MDEDFWDKYLEERRKRIEKEEKDRNDRIDRARRGAQSWELARNCRDIIEEIKTNSWQRNKEMRKEREKLEKEKQDRFRVIKEKRKDMEKKQKQQTLTDMMKKLPEKEKEILEMEERKMQRLELQEIKHNLWRRWRGQENRMQGRRGKSLVKKK